MKTIQHNNNNIQQNIKTTNSPKNLKQTDFNIIELSFGTKLVQVSQIKIFMCCGKYYKGQDGGIQ